MKTNSYMTRALQARDPRYARVLGKLGYGLPETEEDESEEEPAPKPKRRRKKKTS